MERETEAERSHSRKTMQTAPHISTRKVEGSQSLGSKERKGEPAKRNDCSASLPALKYNTVVKLFNKWVWPTDPDRTQGGKKQ